MAAKEVTITIPKEKGASDDVFVGLNGKSWLIKRGVPVTVPEEVLEPLRLAVSFEYDQKTMTASEVPSYPFSILK